MSEPDDDPAYWANLEVMVSGMRDRMKRAESDLQALRAALTALVEELRERERLLLRRADEATTQYAYRLAAEAEGVALAADKMDKLLLSGVANSDRPATDEEAREAGDQVKQKRRGLLTRLAKGPGTAEGESQ
jgi:hypothetical protein